MQTIEIEALTDERNFAVVRLPSRQFPGVVVQGDSLSILVEGLRRSLVRSGQGLNEEAVDEVAEVLRTLEEAQRGYEQALKTHSIRLPY